MKESGEMYLETILLLQKEKKDVRAIDIAEKMGFSKPSVSRAVNKLKEEECITVSESGFISLSKKGKAIARKIYDRHFILTQALINIGVSPDIAAEDACKMEHDISDEAFNQIKKYINK